MSNVALDWAFQQTALRSSEKFILVALANRADDSGVAFPSVARMCSDTGMDRKTALRAISRLCTAEMIADSGQRRGATGGVIVYKLNLQAVPKTAPLSGPKNGTAPKTEQLPISHEAVPFFPTSGPVFPHKRSQKRDTEPKGTIMEPSGEPKAVEQRSTIKNSTVIPLLLNTPEFRAAWIMWLEHLKQRRKEPSLHAQDLQLRKLATFGPQKAVVTIHHCIEHNWQGIYEPRAEVSVNGRVPHIFDAAGTGHEGYKLWRKANPMLPESRFNEEVIRWEDARDAR